MSQQSRQEWKEQYKEFTAFSQLFNKVWAEYNQLQESRPTFPEFWENHVISIDEKLYNTLEEALEPLQKQFNPTTLTETIKTVINKLLSEALNDNEILLAVLTESGKSEAEAKQIIAKMRREE